MDPDLRQRWAYTLGNLGTALIRLTRTPEARSVLVQSEATLDRLAADFPDLPFYSSSLAAMQNNLGVLLKGLGETGESEKYYRKTIGTLAKLAARYPGIPEHPARLGSAQKNLANLLSTAGSSEAAESAGREAVETLEKLIRTYPETPDYQSRLAEALSILGRIMRRAGKSQAAEEAYARAHALQEKLLAGQPGNAAYRNEFGEICDGWALLHVWNRQPPYPDAAKAVELEKKAVGLEPKNSTHWSILAYAQYRAGTWRESLIALDRAGALGSTVTANFFFRAMAHWQLGEKDEARRHYDVAIHHLEKEENPDKETLRLRVEAAALLGVTAAKPPAAEGRPPMP